jgi:hypothetical protein
MVWCGWLLFFSLSAMHSVHGDMIRYFQSGDGLCM